MANIKYPKFFVEHGPKITEQPYFLVALKTQNCIYYFAVSITGDFIREISQKYSVNKYGQLEFYFTTLNILSRISYFGDFFEFSPKDNDFYLRKIKSYVNNLYVNNKIPITVVETEVIKNKTELFVSKYFERI